MERQADLHFAVFRAGVFVKFVADLRRLYESQAPGDDPPFRFTSILSMGWHHPRSRSAAFFSPADLLETGAALKLPGRRMKVISRYLGVCMLRAISSPRSTVRRLRARL